MRTNIWMLFIVFVLASAYVASARWFIVACPTGPGVQLQNSTTLDISSATLAADPQDANQIIVTVRLRMQ